MTNLPATCGKHFCVHSIRTILPVSDAPSIPKPERAKSLEWTLRCARAFYRSEVLPTIVEPKGTLLSSLSILE